MTAGQIPLSRNSPLRARSNIRCLSGVSGSHSSSGSRHHRLFDLRPAVTSTIPQPAPIFILVVVPQGLSHSYENKNGGLPSHGNTKPTVTPMLYITKPGVPQPVHSMAGQAPLTRCPHSPIQALGHYLLLRQALRGSLPFRVSLPASVRPQTGVRLVYCFKARVANYFHSCCCPLGRSSASLENRPSPPT